jgi:hypothetical protein
VWISVNPDTGERIDTFAPASPTFCPASHAQAVHIGKTEYHIQMMDTKQRERHWNATYVDYSSHLLPGLRFYLTAKTKFCQLIDFSFSSRHTVSGSGTVILPLTLSLLRLFLYYLF